MELSKLLALWSIAIGSIANAAANAVAAAPSNSHWTETVANVLRLFF